MQVVLRGGGMKNQYLVIFVTNIFLIACTTTPKSNNYSHTETGRWIASAEEKASAKKSAIMFLTDQVVSQCQAIDEILKQVEEQQRRQEEVQVSLEDLKQAMLTTDAKGNVSLRNPNCKDKIFALAQVVCDGTDDSDSLCEAVRLRRQMDSAMLQLQTADSATVQRTITELTSKIEEQEQLYELSIKDDEASKSIDTRIGVGAALTALGASALAINSFLRSAAGYTFRFQTWKRMAKKSPVYVSRAAGLRYAASALVPLIGTGALYALGALLVVEAGILLYSAVRAFNSCDNTNIERCRRRYFARTHNSVWTGILQVPAKAVIGLISVFKRD